MQHDLETFFEQARAEDWVQLVIEVKKLDSLPEGIFDLTKLKMLVIKSDTKMLYLSIDEDIHFIGTTADRFRDYLNQFEASRISHFPDNTITHILSDPLEELPNEIGELASLEFLTILVDPGGNHIDRISKNVEKLSNLLALELSGGNITELPKEIAQLQKLQALFVPNNFIIKIPSGIGQLSKLLHLDFSNNRIADLPMSFRLLRNLVNLDLKNNALLIPPEILEKDGNPQTIINYYFSLLKATADVDVQASVKSGQLGNNKLLNELKLILVQVFRLKK